VATKVFTQFFDPVLGLQTSSLYNENTINSDLYQKRRILVTQV